MAEFSQVQGPWQLVSRRTEQVFRMQHPSEGFVTFTWHRQWGQWGSAGGLTLLPSVQMFFYPDYAHEPARGSSLVFNLGGHGIHDRSGTSEVIEKIKGLMAEGLWERAVERDNAEPDFTIDWTAGGQLPND